MENLNRPNPNVLSLQETCLRKATLMAGTSYSSAVKRPYTFIQTMKFLKQYLSKLPTTVRDSMLGRILNKHDYDFGCKVYVTVLLLSDTTTELCFPRPCVTEKDAFDWLLQALTAATGLRSLRFTRSYNQPKYTWDSWNVLSEIFVRAANLTTLALPELCNNGIMKVIGKKCEHLQTLDVSGSEVTWKGLDFLTQNIVRVGSGTHSEASTWESSLWKLPNVFTPLEELVLSRNRVHEFERRMSPLCETLRVLRLSDLQDITFRSLLMVLEMVPNMEDTDMMDFFFRTLHQEWENQQMVSKGFNLPSLKLSSLSINSMSDDVFNMVASTCPNLRDLHYTSLSTDDPVSLTMFNRFGFLEKLNVSAKFTTPQDDILLDLLPQIRTHLRFLVLFDWNVQLFQLSTVFSEFENLNYLHLSVDTFLWNDDVKYRSLRNLNTVFLIRKTPGKAIIGIFENTPNLRDITVLQIAEKPDNFMKRVCEVTEPPKLTSFTLLLGRLAETEEEFMTFLKVYDDVTYSGKLPFEDDA